MTILELPIGSARDLRDIENRLAHLSAEIHILEERLDILRREHHTLTLKRIELTSQQPSSQGTGE